jgi:hypothetical protein
LQGPCSKTGNLFFAASVSEVDPALFDAIQDCADQMGQAEGRRHGRIHLMGDLPEVVEMLSGEDDRLQLVRRCRSVLRS